MKNEFLMGEIDVERWKGMGGEKQVQLIKHRTGLEWERLFPFK